LYLFFVNKQQRHHFGNGTQWSTVLWELLTELFVRSYIQQNELLIILSHFKYVHICEDCKSKFVEMHVDASDIYPSALVFYTRHRVNITIYRTVYLHTDMCLQMLTHIQLKNKLWTTLYSSFPPLLQFDLKSDKW
jgi:hypothetical protein